MVRALKIKDFPDYYITDTGDVYSRNGRGTGRIKKLKPQKHKNNYMSIGLQKNNSTHQKLVHRLVAEAFIQNPENKPCINHKNCIRNDNRLENLEWCTYKENALYAYMVSNYEPRFKKKVVCLETKETFSSVMAAARKLNIKPYFLYNHLDGQVKQCKGTHWRYL